MSSSGKKTCLPVLLDHLKGTNGKRYPEKSGDVAISLVPTKQPIKHYTDL